MEYNEKEEDVVEGEEGERFGGVVNVPRLDRERRSDDDDDVAGFGTTVCDDKDMVVDC